MGLDMYMKIRKSEYKCDFDVTGGVKYPKEIESAFGTLKNMSLKSVETTVEYKVGYWRKANAIHKFFVDNCAGGVDDCSEIEVGLDDIRELRMKCLQVLADPKKAGEILPTEDGFFFGSTDYDEWYLQDIKYTADLMEELEAFLGGPNGEGWEAVYRASW